MPGKPLDTTLYYRAVSISTVSRMVYFTKVVTHLSMVVENQKGPIVFDNASLATCPGSDTSDVFRN